MIKYTTATSPYDIEQILQLQWANLPKNISDQEVKDQGFVTVHHEESILTAMNEKFQHVIAKHDGSVVGYALVMLPEFGDKIPVLKPMFDKINTLSYKRKPLKKTPYFVMGQVCVDKAYRGKDVFKGLYQKMKTEMSTHFDCIITEIATRNTRSIRAHEKVGFQSIHIYSTNEEEWAIVGWDWQ